MNKDVVAAYIEKQVQNRGDSTIQPLLTAIANETQHQISIGETLKAAQDKAAKDMKDSQDRMSKMQSDLSTAKASLFEFAKNLSVNAEETVTRE